MPFIGCSWRWHSEKSSASLAKPYAFVLGMMPYNIYHGHNGTVYLISPLLSWWRALPSVHYHATPREYWDIACSMAMSITINSAAHEFLEVSTCDANVRQKRHVASSPDNGEINVRDDAHILVEARQSHAHRRIIEHIRTFKYFINICH